MLYKSKHTYPLLVSMQVVGRILSLEAKQLRSTAYGTFRDLERVFQRIRHQEMKLIKSTEGHLC